jgi:hypothetical protein
MYYFDRLNRAGIAFLTVVLGFGVHAKAIAASWLQDGREPPLHPTVIITEYKGKSYTVSNVHGEYPGIYIDGHAKRLYGKQKYQPLRAVGFAPGFVRFKSQSASSQTKTLTWHLAESGALAVNENLPGGTYSATGIYHCTLIASEAHTDTFIAVIFFRTDLSGAPDLSSSAIAFREVGPLPAGTEEDVTINCSYVAPPGQHYYFFTLVFAKGQEIRTDQSEFVASFFRRQEMASHRSVLEKYFLQFGGSNRPAVPYLRVPPQLPSGVNPSTLPSSIKVRFMVTEGGEVDSLSLDPALDPQVSRELCRSLDGWLFLPCLKLGYPVRTPVETSLSFSPASG